MQLSSFITCDGIQIPAVKLPAHVCWVPDNMLPVRVSIGQLSRLGFRACMFAMMHGKHACTTTCLDACTVMIVYRQPHNKLDPVTGACVPCNLARSGSE